MIELTIEFINGDKEQLYVDSCYETENCLVYSIRFGQKSGEYKIPLSNIKRFKVYR